MGWWRRGARARGAGQANGSARQLIEALLRRSALKEPDGRPLHRYLAGDAELEAFGRLLRAALPREPGGGAQYVAAAFCLFVACWLQRNGGSGPWSWAGPGAALEVALDPVLRTHLTGVGLYYWRRPLRRRDGGTTLYLASLIAEGGLPRLALARPGWLGSYLERVNADLEHSGRADAETASRYALVHLRDVPEAFQHEGVAELMAETALAVVDLRRKVKARAAGADPIQWLDTVDADWRTSFPIQIEDPAAAQIIGRLLDTTIAPPRRRC